MHGFATIGQVLRARPATRHCRDMLQQRRNRQGYVIVSRGDNDPAANQKSAPAARTANDAVPAESPISWQCVLTTCCAVLLLAAIVAALIVFNSGDGAAAADMASVGAMSLADLPPYMDSCPDDLLVALPASLLAMRAAIRAAAMAHAPLTWAEYQARGASAGGGGGPRHVRLRASDFAAGTLRITSPGLFVLDEDVTFHPNAEHDFRPNLPAQDALYGGQSYRLGFFAAIAVESANVTIDLNGHTLSASPVFCAEQKFYAHISVSDQPFVQGQGPTDFGADNVAADGLVIENGTLGLSPHHGVHGNGARRVLLQDLTVREYEVAAIALNGARDVVLRRVHAAGSSRRVAVLGTYSQARLLLLMARRVLMQHGQHAPGSGGGDDVPAAALAAIQAALEPLAALTAHVRADVAATGAIDAVAHPEAHALFANRARMSDGNAYGLVFHPMGAAVSGFWHLHTDQAAGRILVENCTIVDTHARIVEVVALVAPNGAPVRGPAGDVLRVRDNEGLVQLYGGGDGGDGPYNGGNALSRAQAALMAAALAVPDEARRVKLFGTVNGGEPVVRWLSGDAGVTLRSLVRDHGYTWQRNGDAMFHVNKGIVGVRLDGVRGACLHRVAVRDTVNYGSAGLTHALPGEVNDTEAAYTTGLDGGHPGQARQYGYLGADARGLSLAATQDVYLVQVTVDGVHANTGNARAIDTFNYANGTRYGQRCAVRNVTALVNDGDGVAGGRAMMGPKIGQAIGVRIAADTAASTYGLAGVHVSNVVSRALEQAVFLAVDASPEHVSVALTPAEATNLYGFTADAQKK